MGKSLFKLQSDFMPAGDQPQAISALSEGLHSGSRHQTLLGVTGSGKTFTAANAISNFGKPTLVIAHNKTLAAQLASEYRDFFPDSAVHYFVSYYDYYQPEAYMPITDSYIEKEAKINVEISRLRHGATQALLTRHDVIVVASVSCIYGLGSPEEYKKAHLEVSVGEKLTRRTLARRLIGIYYERTTADLAPGAFRAIGNNVEVMPPNENAVYRIIFSGDSIAGIDKSDPITRENIGRMDRIYLFPSKHFIMPENERERAVRDISVELKERLAYLRRSRKILEAERLQRRTNYDIAMIREVGYCSGIENYSRHFDGRIEGEAPNTLLSYFPRDNTGEPDFLTVIDESHVTVPQLAGMYAGDRSRKETLIEHGFRLPSAKDNRPLEFSEFEERVGAVIYTSATPGPYELEKSDVVIEQVIRPTGLIDPEIIVRPVAESGVSQVTDFVEETKSAVQAGGRVLVTVLTKKSAEDLSEYLKEAGIKAEYLHSDIKTVERITILTNFRKGEFDCLVGVNLLREGLDLPEVELIGILDADKEGFLRSETSLVQTIGRAARNIRGRVILYADHVTGSMERAIEETNRRRKLQIAHNKKNEITPKSITKKISDITDQIELSHAKAVSALLKVDRELYRKNPAGLIKEKERQMSEAVKTLDFESAAILRDEIKELKNS
jgi:excinuclease ABC subunit B